MKNQQDHIISAQATLYDALCRLNSLSGEVLTLIATDGSGRVAGTLTDGDIRRALIAGLATSDPVSKAMHRDFRSLDAASPDLEKLREYRRQGITLIPMLRADGTLHRLIDVRRTSTILPLRAVLMAGGKGERLRPLTLSTPKPLLQVGGKPIIDYNVEALAGVGVDDITVITNYLADQVEAHFSSPVAGVQVKCVREPQFLGTIGAASLLRYSPGAHTLVMNSDLLTDISLEDLYLHHLRQDAAVTMAAVPYTVSVPYAIMETDGSRVTGLSEKPTYTRFANAGIYIFANDLLASLPKDTRTDAPDLILQAIEAGRKVSYFPIDGTWIDIGSPADFDHACRLMAMK